MRESGLPVSRARSTAYRRALLEAVRLRLIVFSAAFYSCSFPRAVRS